MNHFDDSLRDQLGRTRDELRYTKERVDDLQGQLRYAHGEVRQSVEREIAAHRHTIEVYQETGRILGPLVGEVARMQGHERGIEGYLSGREEVHRALTSGKQNESIFSKLDRAFGFKK